MRNTREMVPKMFISISSRSDYLLSLVLLPRSPTKTMIRLRGK
jgi:hypothetical protein